MTITLQPALAPSPQPRPAPTVRALPPKPVAQRGQNWAPIDSHQFPATWRGSVILLRLPVWRRERRGRLRKLNVPFAEPLLETCGDCRVLAVVSGAARDVTPPGPRSQETNFSTWMSAGNRPSLAKFFTMADIARSAIEVNSRAAHLGISMCRSGLRCAGDRIAPCNSSPPWSASNSEPCRRSRRTEQRPSRPHFSWP